MAAGADAPGWSTGTEKSKKPQVRKSQQKRRWSVGIVMTTKLNV